MNTESLATVLSFYSLQRVNGVCIQYDLDVKDVFHVTYDNKRFDFGPGGGGLYYFDASLDSIDMIENSSVGSNCSTTSVLSNASSKLNESVTPYSLVQTVAENKLLYTKEDILGAEKARTIQECVAWTHINDIKRV